MALRLGFADLAGLLAALGLPYDSAAARDAAACLTALTRGAAEAASAELAQRQGPRDPPASSGQPRRPPAACPASPPPRGKRWSGPAAPAGCAMLPCWP
ncbi:hypothetical protein ACFQU7_20280 [Pseudoroseomonas wenyumeiae]